MVIEVLALESGLGGTMVSVLQGLVDRKLIDEMNVSYRTIDELQRNGASPCTQ